MKVRDLQAAIRGGRPLDADDSVAKAARLLRARGLPALPVAVSNRLIGLVTATDLLAFAARAPDSVATARDTRVVAVMRPLEAVVGLDQSLLEAAQVMQQAPAEAVPVVEFGGRYVGMLSAREVLAGLSGEPLMPQVAGLATPFGVYLTTGGLRAGAGDLSLFATGAALMILNLVAGGVVYGLSWLATRATEAAGLSPSAEAAAADVPVEAVMVLFAFYIGIFLLLLRLSPLAGVHAGEHMVVHAIEEGEDLTPENVRAMPRVHPRCGTNLMALMVLIVVAQRFLSSLAVAASEAATMLALFILVMIVLVTWRRLGAGLQRWVTTRPPSDRQMAAATTVGEALLGKIRANPNVRAVGFRRIWYTGLIQVMAGFLALALVVEHGGPLLAAVWTRLTG